MNTFTKLLLLFKEKGTLADCEIVIIEENWLVPAQVTCAFVTHFLAGLWINAYSYTEKGTDKTYMAFNITSTSFLH